MTPGRGHATIPAEENRKSLYPSKRVPRTPLGDATPLITYAPNTDASPEAERAALAVALRYVLECHEKKKAGAGSTGGDAKEDYKHDRAEKILPG